MRRVPGCNVSRKGKRGLRSTDYTTAELEGRLEQYFGKDKEEVAKRRYQVVKCVRISFLRYGIRGEEGC